MGQSKASKAAQNQINSASQMAKDQYVLGSSDYQKYRSQADKAFENDYGESGTDYFSKSNAQGRDFANKATMDQARGATAAAQNAARASGLSRGASALQGSAAANNTFQNNYGNAVQQGIGNYQSSVGQYQNVLGQNLDRSAGIMGSGSSGQANAAGLASNEAQNRHNRGWGTATNLLGIGGGIAGAYLSDENKKENIRRSGNMKKLHRLGQTFQEHKKTSDERMKEGEPIQNDLVKDFAELVNAYDFNYKPDNPDGEDPNVNHTGVMAQELESVPGLENTIVEDEEGVKRVDMEEMVMSLTALVSEMAKKIEMLEQQMGGE